MFGRERNEGEVVMMGEVLVGWRMRESRDEMGGWKA